MTAESILAQLAGIGVIAIVAQWLAWWVKLPAILFLLLSGLLLGPISGWLAPNELFGHLLFPFVSLAVSVILFEGALTLRFDQLRGIEGVVRNMVSFGLFVTWGIVAVAAHVFVGFDWPIAFLFGAVMVVTGPTVIVPLLRTVRPKENIANILRWEGILIDPIGALLAVLVFEFVVISGHGSGVISHTVWLFAKVVLVGSALGAITGYLFGLSLRHHLLPEYLQSFTSLLLVFAVFTLANSVAEESGLLAVTVMGMWLANMKHVDIDEILNFKESLSIFLISGLFIVLAARIEFPQLAELGWASVGVFLVIQLIARPLKVFVSTIGSSLSFNEKLLLSWIAPRGIIAAAVTALFALRLQEQGVAGAELLVPMAFIVIIGTVVLQSATAGWIAQKLGVAEPQAQGFLVIGANPVAIAISKALNDLGFKTLLSDSNWEYIRNARMQGLSVYYGNPVSTHADTFLNLVGLGNMLGLSRRSELNALAAARYRTEFGIQNIYTLQSSLDTQQSEERKTGLQFRGSVLFGDNVSQEKLASLLAQGAAIKTTALSEEFTYEDFNRQHGKDVLPLFAVNKKGRIKFFLVDAEVEPTVGWKIVSLFYQSSPQEAPAS